MKMFKKNRVFIFSTFLVFLLVGGNIPEQAEALAEAANPAPLNTQDLDDIIRVERYLEGITTIQSRFIQMSSTGETSEGDVMIWRPGRLRIDYDPPSPIEITSNGLFLVYHDTELKQTTHVPLGTTPIGVIVSETVRLNDEDLQVIHIGRGANTLEMTVIRRDDPLAGRVTLVFTDNPLRLERWVVLDAQGITTNFALIGQKPGVSLDPELFKVEKYKLKTKQ